MDDARLFGRLALHHRLITEDQLVAALDQQRREGGGKRLGEILLERGDLDSEQFERLLEAQKHYLARAAERAREARAKPPPPAPVPPPAAAAPSESGARELLTALLQTAVSQRASDLHIHAGTEPRLRQAGRFSPVPFGPLAAEQAEAMVRSVLDPEQRAELDRGGQVDLALGVPGIARFRVNAYRQQRGVDAVFRLIPAEPPTLLELGLPAELARLANFGQGLVLATGPGGCGKTSTLAALVRILNAERRDHVITIEDPVEYLHPPQRCVVNQRQVGRDTGSFARALRAALREDPDVIVIGELRDTETISLALTAAETGHLVLASMHTTNSIATINRLVGAFPPEQQGQARMLVSETLRAVVSQRLVPRADGTGRVPALEMLWGTRAVANLIREAKTYQIRSILQTGATHGMVALDASLDALVKSGTIDRDEARRAADNPQRFEG
jgi:twitching motility protein PilT